LPALSAWADDVASAEALAATLDAPLGCAEADEATDGECPEQAADSAKSVSHAGRPLAFVAMAVVVRSVARNASHGSVRRPHFSRARGPRTIALMERLYEKVPRPVNPGEAESFLAPLTIGRTDAEARIRDAIFDRTLRPADIETATVDEPHLLLVPLWRVDVSVDGHHVGLSSVSVGSGNTRIPLPVAGARHKDAVLIVRGRSSFPLETAAPALLNGIFSGTSPIELGLHDLEPLASARFDMDLDERVDADVPRDQAEREAKQVILRAVAPSNALFSSYEPAVRSAQFVLYPVYYSRYRYAGEAQRNAGESYFVALSGHTGKVIASHHPSGLRAAAARVRRFLSFD